MNVAMRVSIHVELASKTNRLKTSWIQSPTMMGPNCKSVVWMPDGRIESNVSRVNC